MPKSFFAGRSGSEFIIRQLAAGANDADPALNHIIFDSRGYPGRVLGSGEFLASGSTWQLVGIGAYGAVAGNTSSAHGLSSMPTHVVATARPEVESSGAPELWYGWSAPTPSGVGPSAVGQRSPYGGEVMGRRYITPFHIDYRYTIDSNNGFVLFSGWSFTWDPTNINVKSWLCATNASGQPMKLRVKWTALEM